MSDNQEDLNQKADIDNVEEISQLKDSNTPKKKKSILSDIVIAILILLILIIGIILLSLFAQTFLEEMSEKINKITYKKPIIYLYPIEETQVEVSVNFKDGDFICTYPKYNDGWSVIAEPDGTLYDINGNEYYCLYWEGESNIDYDMSKGFVIKGDDTAEFLREKLLYMGLTPKEANEFIIYWLPLMEKNPYNLITFQNDIYSENVELNINPNPDSVLRIFMVYQSLDEYIEIEEQELSTFERTGFSVIEWGGSQIN